MFINTKIHVQNVRKGFPTEGGQLDVIEDLDFKVGDSEFVAIVGPSGCGKTTLMNILTGFLAPDSGAVLVDDKPRTRPDPRGILITQQGSVFPWLTVRQNLLFGLPEDKPDRELLALQYAEMVGLKGFDADTVFGFYAPGGTPADVIAKLNGEINRILGTPALRERIAALGGEPAPMSPTQFAAKAAEDSRRFGAIIKERKIVGD